MPLIHYPLHIAAATGDVPELKRSLAYFDIESRDNLHLTPLHVAVLSKQQDAVTALIEQGAKVYAAGAYDQNLSSLDLAVIANDPAILKILLNEKSIHSSLRLPDLASLVVFSFDRFCQSMQQSQSGSDFTKSLEVFTLLVDAQKTALLDLQSSDMTPGLESAAAWLEGVASFAPTRAIYTQIMDQVAIWKDKDHTYDQYIQSKILLHTLPINGDYTIFYEGQASPINPEGFIPCFTTPVISEGIDYYLANYLEPLTTAAHIFESISTIYHQATVFSQQHGIFDSAREAYHLYSQGQMVLFTSGWSGHMVSVILDPVHDYFIVGNGGQQYSEVLSGATIYKMHNAENLTPNLIFSLMNNQSQQDFELLYKYQLALDPVEYLEQPLQIQGNCSWYSHKPAIEALLYLHFLNEGCANHTAKYWAKHHFLAWDNAEKIHCLENYFENDPVVSVNAVLDLLVEHQPTLFIHEDQPDRPIDHQEYLRAEYLVNILEGPIYASDLLSDLDALDQVLSEAKPELIALFHSIDIPDLHDTYKPDGLHGSHSQHESLSAYTGVNLSALIPIHNELFL